MTYTAVQPEDLGIYLGELDIDLERAQKLLDLATSLCLSVVSPLPDGAEAVVLDVATRALNPRNAQSDTAGPYSMSFGAAAGGLWLTRQNKSTLRRLAGTGGAFTVEVGPSLGEWEYPPWVYEGFAWEW
jgi:hypothetical protein